jgi:hypothetical protein
MQQALLPVVKIKKGKNSYLYDWAGDQFAFNDEVHVALYSREGNVLLVHCIRTHIMSRVNIRRCRVFCIAFNGNVCLYMASTHNPHPTPPLQFPPPPPGARGTTATSNNDI